ncbi:MAG: hypothetical protein DRN11_03430 [Thermoplasmata archaeon]|nr:MAG: hypothetical protein DRN11_03430 [Thermoplasmata archaeon]
MIILDTDVLIEIMDRKSKKSHEILKEIEDAEEDIAITSLTLHEILYGLYKYRKRIPEELLKLETIEYSQKDVLLSAKLEAEAERKGKKITRIDCMIAAIAINKGAKLCTLNKKHFEAFDNLSLFPIDI